MSFRNFVFEDNLNKLVVIVHKMSSSETEIVVERYRRKSLMKDKSCDPDLCVTVANSWREYGELLVDHVSHKLFSEIFSLSVVGSMVIANLNKNDEQYNICCVYGDRYNLIEKLNRIVYYLISIGFPITRVREADE